MEDEEMLDTTNETENDETLTSEENEEMETDAIDEEVEETEEDSDTEDNSEDEDDSEEETDSEEKSEKTFTQEELNSIVQERVRKLNNTSKRNEESIRREYEDRMSEVENVLNAGFGTSNLDEGLNRIRELCKQKGIDIPKKNKGQYSKEDLKILADANAREIINDGYEAIENELSRLTRKGADNMSEREQMIFLALDEEKKKIDSKKELKSIGAKDEILESKEYNDFADKFAGSKFTSKEIYQMYIKENKPKEKAEPIGSMKNPNPKEKKDFITEAEYDKMTAGEIEENMSLIRKSMLQW